MKKIIYIIPGWKESSQYKIYQSLVALAKEKGYDAIFYEIDWSRPLSSQIFPVQKDAVSRNSNPLSDRKCHGARKVTFDLPSSSFLSVYNVGLHNVEDRHRRSAERGEVHAF